MQTLKSVLAPDQSLPQTSNNNSKSLKNNKNSSSPWNLDLGNINSLE
jgi:hypothetical protein